MADPNVIAYLYPADDQTRFPNALDMVCMPENRSRYIQALSEDYSLPSTHTSVDGVSDDDDDGSNNGDQGPKGANEEELPGDYSPGLQLRFDDKRKNRAGFVIGTGRDADIVLPRRGSVDGLAHRQCALTFDNQGRLILRDLQRPRKTKGGTAVAYNDQGGQEKRRSFTWIVGGHDFLGPGQIVVIVLHDLLKLRICFANHDILSPQYQDKVAQFRHGAVENADDISFGGIDFQSLESSAAPSGDQTLSGDPVFIHIAELGIGGQAKVTRVWNASNGLSYAAKAPLKPEYWVRLKREVYLLKKIDHVSWLNVLHKAIPTNAVVAQCRQSHLVDGSQNTTVDPRIRPLRISPRCKPGNRRLCRGELGNPPTNSFGVEVPPRARRRNRSSRHQAGQHPRPVAGPLARQALRLWLLQGGG